MSKIVKISWAFTNETSSIIEVLFDKIPILDAYNSDPLIWLPVLEWALERYPRTSELVRKVFEKWAQRYPKDGFLHLEYKALKGCSIATALWFSLKWLSPSYRWHTQTLPFFAVRQFPNALAKTFWVDGLEPVYFIIPHLPANPPNPNNYQDFYAKILTDTIPDPPPETLRKYYYHYKDFFQKSLRASISPEPLNGFTMKEDSYHRFGVPPETQHGEYRLFPEHLEAIFAGIVDEPDRCDRWLVFADALQETFEDAEAHANFIRLIHAPLNAFC